MKLDFMTDEEYRKYLEALARKHVKPGQLYKSRPDSVTVEQLAYDIERLSSANRLLRAVRERSDNPVLLNELSRDLRKLHENRVANDVIDAMEAIGMLDALDEAPEVTFENLRWSAIPPDDIQLLARAGVDDPESEITILIRQQQMWAFYRASRIPSEIARQVPAELLHAAEAVDSLPSQVNQPVPKSERKKRKLFNGIGKLLSGMVTGGSNILLAAGTFIAPNPATAYLAMGSSAVAILYMGQGIGDLRGEG
jgi:hypothetical protein